MLLPHIAIATYPFARHPLKDVLSPDSITDGSIATRKKQDPRRRITHERDIFLLDVNPIYSQPRHRQNEYPGLGLRQLR